ncbi:MAG: hypothetical protein JNK79_01690 [Chitinophagaceae bacterium]|nr:hypothetical protein [Chitinophagaceae bacterium]
MKSCSRYTSLVCLLVSTIYTSSTAQTYGKHFDKADSAFALASLHSDSAISVANTVLIEANEANDSVGIANAWNALGWALMHKGFLDSSVTALEKAWRLFAAVKSEDNTVKAWINLSEVYIKQSKFSDAIRYLIRADSLSLKTKNTAYHTNVMRLFAIVYRESKDYKQAAAYFNQALTGFVEMKDYFRYIGTGISLSILYRNMGFLDSSLLILQRCLALEGNKITMTPYTAAMVREHVAETYYGMKNYQLALEHYLFAYRTFEKIDNRADMAFEAFSVGKTLAQLKRYDEAEGYLLRSYTMNDTLRMTNYMMDASAELAKLYQQTGDWRKAFQYQQKTSELKDSLNIAEQIRQTTELKERFETEKKEQQILLLKTQNQLASAEARRTRLIQYTFILLFVVSVVIAFLLLNRYKIKRRLQEQVLRNQIAGDLHDDIGSALSAIDISSRIALNKNSGDAAVSDQLVKIQRHTRKTMDSMSDIIWSINPGNNDFGSMLMRMREFAAEICEPLQIDLRFRTPEEIEHINLNANTRKSVFLVFKEAVNNAVKYSGASVIDVEFEKLKNNRIGMKIRDNGGGFDIHTVKRGNGLNNMTMRADQLDGQLDIVSTIDQGTSVSLSFTI